MISLFFFASGLSALIYQVVWTRAAGLALGNSPTAVGIVVAVFMAGLAIGSAWAGRAAPKVRPLRWYGAIEIAIGLFGLAVPWMFRAASGLQKAAYETALFAPVGILCSALILLPATILMGATFPLLVQHAGANEAAGRLYAVNSGGAALGALGAGLFLVPRIGLAATTAVAVILNIAIGLGAIRMSSKAPTLPPRPTPQAPLTRVQKVAVGVYCLSGFAALVCEMAWTRALVLALGSTVYAFALILSGFILGLALGSEIGARRVTRLQRPLEAAALIQLLIAGWGAALVVLLADLPAQIEDVVHVCAQNFLVLQLAEALLVLALVLPPTMLMGALLPVSLAVFKTETEAPGRSVGRLYAANTLAAIAGTMAATFLLVPLWGVDATLRIAIGVNLAGTVLAITGDPGAPRKGKVRLAVGTGIVGLALLLLPRWDLAVSASGAYLPRPDSEQTGRHEGHLPGTDPSRFELEAAYWDAFGLVTVHRSPSRRLLRVNGKVDASSGGSDMPAQILTAQIPLVLHPKPEDVLVIGLASGITLASAQAHKTRRVDCLEISPAVVRASNHFRDLNENAASKPGTTILIQDGRTHIRYCAQSYDVIVSQPSNLWISGMANLFTLEFFHEARRRLRPGGIFAQWIHTYRISPDDFRGVVRTFTQVFPHSELWEMEPEGDYLLTGSIEPRSLRWDRIRERLSSPAVAGKLRSAGIPDPANFLACYVMGSRDVTAIGAAGRLLTDDDCWIEYSAPLWMLRQSVVETFRMFEGRRRSARELFEPGSLDEDHGRTLDQLAESRRRLWEAIASLVGKQTRRFTETMDSLVQTYPADALVRDYADRQGKVAYHRALQLKSEGDLELAQRFLSVVPASCTVHAEALILKGWILAVSGKRTDAETLYRKALAERPRMLEAQISLAQIAEAEGRLDEARGLLEEAIQWAPQAPAARVAFARFLWRRSEKDRARAEVERAVRDNPGDAAATELRESFKRD